MKEGTKIQYKKSGETVEGTVVKPWGDAYTVININGEERKVPNYAIRAVPSEEFRDGSREGDQPPPTKNEYPIIQELVRLDLEDRLRIGMQRYGTGLQPHNGRDMLRDAYDEALDLAVYLRGAIYERDGQ